MKLTKIEGIISIGVLVASGLRAGPADVDVDLARLLASSATRQEALARVAASPNTTVPVLLLWTQTPPRGVDAYELKVGLADAFAKLRTEAAIPFLIREISMRRDRDVDFAPWLKSATAVEYTFPAANALIQIGPAASKRVIAAAQGSMPARDLLTAIFVVGRVRGVPEAYGFLTAARAEAKSELAWAELGLKALEP